MRAVLLNTPPSGYRTIRARTIQASKASFNLKKLLDFLQSLPTETDRLGEMDFERLRALIGVSAGE